MPLPQSRIIISALLLALAVGAIGFSIVRPEAVRAALDMAVNPASTRTIAVSSVGEIVREAKAARKHTVLRLAPGTYPDLILGGIDSAEGLVIESADPANPASFSGVTVKGSNGITLRNLVISRPPDHPPQQYLALFQGASKLTVDGLELVGQGDPALDKMISAMMIRNCSDVTVMRSHFSRFRYALSFLSGNRITITRNELHDLRTDAIRGGGVDDLTITQNVIGNFQPAKGDHPDGIQLWSNNESKPAKRISIRDNLVVRDEGGIIQGIFIRDTKRQLPFEQVEISGNLIVGSMFNGISIDGAHGARISNNVVIPEGAQKSWIRVERADGVELADNRAMLFIVGKEAKAKQRGSKGMARLKGDLAPIVRAWLQTKPELQAAPGPYLRKLAGITAQ